MCIKGSYEAERGEKGTNIFRLGSKYIIKNTQISIYSSFFNYFYQLLTGENNPMKIQIINGPNLNLLGKREPEKYGNVTFEEYLSTIRKLFPAITFDYYQSNIEGEIIDRLHETGFSYDGIILNPGGYTHTSVSVADAVASIKTPVIEVHISNITAREEFRHTSLVGRYCAGSIIGLGLDGYRLAAEALIEIRKKSGNTE
jgi:3-dehydroquinate dehydratase II